MAESSDVLRRDGVVYFPPETVRWRHLRPGARRTWCPWKGIATYFEIEVDGATLTGSAWTYRRPWPSAGNLKQRVGFGRPVRVEASPD